MIRRVGTERHDKNTILHGKLNNIQIHSHFFQSQLNFGPLILTDFVSSLTRQRAENVLLIRVPNNKLRNTHGFLVSNSVWLSMIKRINFKLLLQPNLINELAVLR